MGLEYARETKIKSSLSIIGSELFSDNFLYDNSWVASGNGADFLLTRSALHAKTAGQAALLRTRTTGATAGDTVSATITIPSFRDNKVFFIADFGHDGATRPGIMRFLFTHFWKGYTIGACAQFAVVGNVWHLLSEGSTYIPSPYGAQVLEANSDHRIVLSLDLDSGLYTDLIVDNIEHPIQAIPFLKIYFGTSHFSSFTVEIETTTASPDIIYLDKVDVFS